MARQLTNVSGETRTLQDSHGRWHVVGDGEIYTVDDRDDREFPAQTWEDVPARKTGKKTTTTDEENG